MAKRAICSAKDSFEIRSIHVSFYLRMSEDLPAHLRKLGYCFEIYLRGNFKVAHHFQKQHDRMHPVPIGFLLDQRYMIKGISGLIS